MVVFVDIIMTIIALLMACLIKKGFFQLASRCCCSLSPFLLYNRYVKLSNAPDSMILLTPIVKFSLTEYFTHDASPNVQPKVKNIAFHIE
jgi:hypothetical protein